MSCEYRELVPVRNQMETNSIFQEKLRAKEELSTFIRARIVDFRLPKSNASAIRRKNAMCDSENLFQRKCLDGAKQYPLNIHEPN